jgi:hypothetical protein
MLRQFYSSPPALAQYSPETLEAYSFPATLPSQAEYQHFQAPPPSAVGYMQQSPKYLLYLAGGFLGVKLALRAMGPNGDALKIILNKRKSLLEYYGIRIVPFAIAALIAHDIRSEIGVSNPYATGELL